MRFSNIKPFFKLNTHIHGIIDIYMYGFHNNRCSFVDDILLFAKYSIFYKVIFILHFISHMSIRTLNQFIYRLFNSLLSSSNFYFRLSIPISLSLLFSIFHLSIFFLIKKYRSKNGNEIFFFWIYQFIQVQYHFKW